MGNSKNDLEDPTKFVYAYDGSELWYIIDRNFWNTNKHLSDECPEFAHELGFEEVNGTCIFETWDNDVEAMTKLEAAGVVFCPDLYDYIS